MEGSEQSTSPLPPPIPRELFGNLLVETSGHMIEEIWETTAEKDMVAAKALRKFISELLMRSKASHSTLYLALYYTRRIKPVIAHDLSKYPPQNMFFAALILAGKYLQDVCFSNRSWAKLTGIPVMEITVVERLFLKKIAFKLHVKVADFDAWAEIIHDHTSKLYATHLIATGVVNTYHYVKPNIKRTNPYDDVCEDNHESASLAPASPPRSPPAPTSCNNIIHPSASGSARQSTTLPSSSPPPPTIKSGDDSAQFDCGPLGFLNNNKQVASTPQSNPPANQIHTQPQMHPEIAPERLIPAPIPTNYNTRGNKSNYNSNTYNGRNYNGSYRSSTSSNNNYHSSNRYNYNRNSVYSASTNPNNYDSRNSYGSSNYYSSNRYNNNRNIICSANPTNPENYKNLPGPIIIESLPPPRPANGSIPKQYGNGASSSRPSSTIDDINLEEIDPPPPTTTTATTNSQSEPIHVRTKSFIERYVAALMAL